MTTARRPPTNPTRSRWSPTTRSRRRPRRPTTRSTPRSTSSPPRRGSTSRLLVAGDTGTMLSKAALTAGNPEGDVMWGDRQHVPVAGHRGRRLRAVRRRRARRRCPTEFTDLVPERRGDAGRFRRRVRQLRHRRPRCGRARSAELARRPRRARVRRAARRAEPGHVVARARVPARHDRRVRRRRLGGLLDDRCATTTSRSSTAGPRPTTRSSPGPRASRPLVVSYGSSPPFEVLFAAEPLDTAPTGVVESTCFRQVEFAGVLRGTDAPTRPLAGSSTS